MALTLEMSPPFTSNDLANRRWVKAKLLRDGSLGQMAIRAQLPDGNNILIGQFCNTTEFSICRAAPSLDLAITGIVSHCAQEKMITARTKRCIATMTYQKPRRGPLAMLKKPSNMVRRSGLVTAVAHSAISITRNVALPKTAARSKVTKNLLVKSNLHRLAFMRSFHTNNYKLWWTLCH